MSDPILEAALAYHEMGFAVLPVTKDKQPYLKWEQYQDRWRREGQTLEDVKYLFDCPEVPRYGIGLLMHPYSPIVALDFDGPHALECWQRTRIELPETATNYSPSGGPHLCLLVPEKTDGLKRTIRLVQEEQPCGWKGGKACGVDLIVNGYIAAPPTPGYREDPDRPFGRFAALPEGVIALTVAAPAEPVIVHGRRNDTLTSLAGSMRRRGLDAEEIFAALLKVNERRCRPPLPEGEVQEIATSVSRYEPADDATKDASPVIDATVGVDAFLLAPPILEMDVEGLRVRGDHGWTVAAPKAMKGLVSLEEARACSTGTPCFGHFATRKSRVLYVSEEDRRERLHRRVHAMLAGRPQEEIPGAEDLRFLVKAGVRLDTKQGREILCAHLARWKPDLVFLEHFDKLHSRDANKAADVKPLLDVLDQLHAEFRCTFRIQKHTRKEAAGQSRRKGEMIAGTVAQFGWGESNVYLTLLKRGLAQVETEAKDGDTAPRFLVKYDAGRLVYAGDVQVNRREEMRQKALEAIESNPGMSTADVAKALGVTDRTAGTHLRALEAEELVVGKQDSSRQPKYWWLKSIETEG